eukprot:41090-Chlamydomonas_euryale.AAC.3
MESGEWRVESGERRGAEQREVGRKDPAGVRVFEEVGRGGKGWEGGGGWSCGERARGLLGGSCERGTGKVLGRYWDGCGCGEGRRTGRCGLPRCAAAVGSVT